MANKKGSRRLARERAFRVLYGLAFAEEEGQANTQAALADQPRPESEPRLNAKAEEFLRELALGAWDRRSTLDKTIGQFSQNWKVERIARVDLALLRLGMFELLHRPDVPSRVAINEAVELAKAYGDHNTPGFVNGILDAAARALGRGELQAVAVAPVKDELKAGAETASASGMPDCESRAPSGDPSHEDNAAAVQRLIQALNRLELREHGAAHRVAMGVSAALGDSMARYYLPQEGCSVPARVAKADLAQALRLSETAVAGQLGGGRSSLNAALKERGAGIQLKLDRHGARLLETSGREWPL